MKQIHAYVRTILKSRGGRNDYNTVSDVVSESLMEATKKGMSQEDPKFRGFLVIGCMRSIQRNGRARKMENVSVARLTPSREPAVIDTMIQKELLDAVMVELGNLPDYLKETMLHFLSGKDAYESAEIRGVSPTSVRVDRCRAVGILRKRLTKSA
jgi:DNA-directed RNA polymerase specialized sigma24 family protein